jgi:hypothetical protein
MSASDSGREGLLIDINVASEEARTELSRTRSSVADVGDEASETAGEMQVLAGATDEAGDEAAGAAVRIEVLSGRVDDLGDELDETSRAADDAQRSLARLGGGINIGRLRTARRLLGGIVGAGAAGGLGAAAAGGGLFAAGAAGGSGLVLGSGALAFGAEEAEAAQEELASVNDELREQRGLLETVGPRSALGRRARQEITRLEERREELEEQTTAAGALEAELAGVREQVSQQLIGFGQARGFDDLVGGTLEEIPALTEDILGEIDEGDLEPFVDTLTRLGRSARNALPGLVDRLLRLGRRALPAVNGAIGFLEREGDDILDGAVDSAEQLAPKVGNLLSTIAEDGDEYKAFADTTVNTLVPALNSAADAAGEAVAAFNDLPEEAQKAVILGASASLLTNNRPRIAAPRRQTGGGGGGPVSNAVGSGIGAALGSGTTAGLLTGAGTTAGLAAVGGTATVLSGLLQSPIKNFAKLNSARASFDFLENQFTDDPGPQELSRGETERLLDLGPRQSSGLTQPQRNAVGQVVRIAEVTINASSREAAREGVRELRRLSSEVRRVGGG